MKVKLKTGEIETLATNLDPEKFSKDDLKELYGQRWSIETGYDQLKNLIQIEEFSGRNRIKIEQDTYAHIFIYNLATTIKIDANKKIKRKSRNKDNKYIYSPNFSAIISLIYQELYDLLNDPPSLIEQRINYIILQSSKEVSQERINENKNKERMKPDYCNKHSGFIKNPK